MQMILLWSHGSERYYGRGVNGRGLEVTVCRVKGLGVVGDLSRHRVAAKRMIILGLPICEHPSTHFHADREA